MSLTRIPPSGSPPCASQDGGLPTAVVIVTYWAPVTSVEPSPSRRSQPPATPSGNHAENHGQNYLLLMGLLVFLAGVICCTLGHLTLGPVGVVAGITTVAMAIRIRDLARVKIGGIKGVNMLADFRPGKPKSDDQD
jgi:hypothetical protein